MWIQHVILKVDDQERALAFYAGVLGFEKAEDEGGARSRWLTVASPATPGGAQLLLESNALPPSRTAQRALRQAGFPAAVLSTDDIAADYRRLKAAGVTFRGVPRRSGSARSVFFDDTCGNFIVLRQASG